MKALLTAVMLTVIATAGFASRIETANKVIPNGRFISTIGNGFFVMAHKGKVYTCFEYDLKIRCQENTEY